MEDIKEVVLVFASVHYTLKAETCLKLAKWFFVVIPVPPALNEGCSLGIKITLKDQQVVTDYLGENGIIPIKIVLAE